MPGRHAVYPTGTETVSVPLMLSVGEAEHLRATVAPSRAAAVRAVVVARVAADAVARGDAPAPDDEVGLLEAEASCLRLKRQALAVGDTDAADRLEAARLAIGRKRLALAVNDGGLTVNPQARK